MAFKYGNFVATALATGETIADDATSIEIDSNKRDQFAALVENDNEAVLVISEEVGGETKFEIVKMTGTSGNDIEVVRAQEGTTAQEFTSAAKIASTVTAERAALLGGTANLDVMPDADDTRKLGETGTAFSEVHAKEFGVKAGSQEFVIKANTAVSATADSVDLMLPKDTGTLARLEDSVEAHPGCFSGALCVEPAPEEVVDAVARGNSDIGDGIHLVAYYADQGQQKMKLAKYKEDGATIVSVLGMELVPGTGGEDEPDAQYRRQTITVDGNDYSYLNATFETVGDFEIVDGDIPAGFTQELVGTWLENITFTRQPPGLFVAQKIYGQDVSADTVRSPDIEGEKIKPTKHLNIPVLVATPGKDDDSTEGYIVGSVIYCTTTNAPYVCIDSAEGNASWRPMVTLSPSVLTQLGMRNYNSNDRALDVGVADLSGFKRLYTSYASEQWGAAATPTQITNQIVDYDDFKGGQHIVNGHTQVEYKSDTSVTFRKSWGGRASDWDESTTWLWGEA